MNDVFTGMQQAVPFVRTLGLEAVELTADRVVLRLPDLESQRNHVGGPHAGAMFSLGESATGALVLMNFADTLDRAVPLAVSASISYLKLALGPVTATATLARPPAAVRAELDAGERPEFEIAVELTTEDGTVTGEMTVLWTLRPHRRD